MTITINFPLNLTLIIDDRKRKKDAESSRHLLLYTFEWMESTVERSTDFTSLISNSFAAA